MSSNTGRLISIKAIADRLMQNPLLKDLNFEFIVLHAVDCLRLIGSPGIFVSKKEKVKIKNYKGEIPFDLMQVSSVLLIRGSELIPMTSSEDTIHNHYDDLGNSIKGRLTYNLGNNTIFTSVEEGEVVIVYKSIATDEECYPMIIDNTETVRAIESYIRYKWFDILNDMDQISDRKLNKAETDYAFNVAQAQVHLQMPSEDEMENLVNSITQILPSRLQHSERFKFLGTQEFLKII